MGTSACSLRNAQAARKGGRSRSVVSSSIKSTAESGIFLILRTRAPFSAPGSAPSEQTRSAAVSSEGPPHADAGAGCVRSACSRSARADALPEAVPSRPWQHSRTQAAAFRVPPPGARHSDQQQEADGPCACHRPSLQDGGAASSARATCSPIAGSLPKSPLPPGCRSLAPLTKAPASAENAARLAPGAWLRQADAGPATKNKNLPTSASTTFAP